MAIEHRQAQSRSDNLEYITRMVDEISHIKPDIIVLPECFGIVGVEDKEDKVSEADKQLVIALAKKYKTYIIGPVYTARKGKIYNTALVVDKRGKITGSYEKIHPTENEIRKGVTPGNKNQLPIKTDFGKIAVQTCFDAHWQDTWRDFINKGAEIIFFVSAYPAGNYLNSIALLNQVFIVPSTWTLDSGIIDNTGRWVSKTDYFTSWTWAVIDLDRTVFHYDFNRKVIKDVLKKYEDKINIDSFYPEDLFTLESKDPRISISKVAKEFKLVTYKNYIKRATAACDKAASLGKKTE
jgi:predicted amidohydrolase